MPPDIPGGTGRRQEVRVKFDGGEAYALFLPPDSPKLQGSEGGPRGQRNEAPLLMFMHGNGELADYWTREFDEPRVWGIGVAAGRVPGLRSRAGRTIREIDHRMARALYEWAQHDPRIDATRIVCTADRLAAASRRASPWIARSQP